MLAEALDLDVDALEAELEFQPIFLDSVDSLSLDWS